MTRKDYRAIAAALKPICEASQNDLFMRGEVVRLINSLCESFKHDNPAFRRQTFLEACGEQ